MKLPDEIQQLISRCEVNEHTFSNDDMSAALKFGEIMFRRVAALEKTIVEARRGFRRSRDRVEIRGELCRISIDETQYPEQE